MGVRLFDQYTLLHFATGVITYFWGISLGWFIFLHTAFELLENTQLGMRIINRYVTFWPGGKPQADSVLNRFGDSIAAVLGWIMAYLLDYYGKKYNWYM